MVSGRRLRISRGSFKMGDVTGMFGCLWGDPEKGRLMLWRREERITASCP